MLSSHGQDSGSWRAAKGRGRRLKLRIPDSDLQHEMIPLAKRLRVYRPDWRRFLSESSNRLPNFCHKISPKGCEERKGLTVFQGFIASYRAGGAFVKPVHVCSRKQKYRRNKTCFAKYQFQLIRRDSTPADQNPM